MGAAFDMEGLAVIKGGKGGRPARSETVSVRLDPKLRYLAELAARKQRRALSSFIEWAIEASLNQVKITDFGSSSISVADMSETLWDVDPTDRFVKLAFHYPDLLTHPEQILWKLIRENGLLWRGSFTGLGDNRKWAWTTDKKDLITDRLRTHWEAFQNVALGRADRSTLPKWQGGPKPPTSDDVPF